MPRSDPLGGFMGFQLLRYYYLTEFFIQFLQVPKSDVFRLLQIT